ncbi:MAG: sugar ABC transporter permease [Oscillospiraceae bacterium]|nr:sugar ABC transporter permease [Oscillospiraceae bacterium]
MEQVSAPALHSRKKKAGKINHFATPWTLKNAAAKGDWKTRLSFLIMGFGNFAHKQIVKGAVFLAGEAAFIGFMLASGGHAMSMLLSLGGKAQQKVWNEAKGIYEYAAGDNSLLILLYGIASIAIVVLFALLWLASVKSCYKAQYQQEHGKHVNSFADDVKDLFDTNLQGLLMPLPLIGIFAFTLLPLIFMISMAFTNYSREGDHLILFNWVGLQNFGRVLSFGGNIGKTFWSVLGWTLIWAVLATFLNYILGMILALIINRKDTKIKGFWRFCFVLSVAVPQFVSLLIMRTMLQPNGAVNVLLQEAGLISSPLPFFTDATWARATVIIINLWVGIPFTMLQVTGILQNIPKELYEAAKVDGANSVVIFFKITLPYMLFVTTPYLITTFTGNINNFNVIYLLSGGDPVPVGMTAGKTDLLVTWLYKLTVDQQFYDLASVIGILTFVIMMVVALVTYHRSGSYNNEEAFR